MMICCAIFNQVKLELSPAVGRIVEIKHINARYKQWKMNDILP